MQKRKMAYANANPPSQLLLFRPPADSNLDFITTALSRANANLAKYARTSRRINHHMGQISICASEIRKRSSLLVETRRD